MQSSRDLKVLPVAAARRGRPPVGFGLRVADGLAFELPEAATDPLVRCIEDGPGGPLGVLELDVVAASLVVDPEGALAELARLALERMRDGGAARAKPVAVVELEHGIHGVRVDADLLRDRHGGRPSLPYLSVVALAGFSMRGGVVVTIRAAAETWDAGEQIVASLQALDRGRASGHGGGGGLVMPARR